MYDFCLDCPESWEDLLYDAFGTAIPGKAEWHDAASVCRILNTMAAAATLNIGTDTPALREAFPGPDPGTLILRIQDQTRTVHFVKLLFRCPDQQYPQSYFLLETSDPVDHVLLVSRESAQTVPAFCSEVVCCSGSGDQ
ncbi:MAG TPA: hypothetical protein VN611_16205 [Patescibacteria group bacterium]|nr:hypothetical protein [Patescibacteria group bacterium]